MIDFEELMRLGEESGIPLNKVNQWYRGYGKDPALKDKSAAQIINAIQTQRGKKTEKVDPYATTPPQAFAAGGKVDESMVGDDVGMALPQPYQAGTPMAVQGNTNMAPSQEGMARAAARQEKLSQMMAEAARLGFRPDEMAAAQQEFIKKQSIPGRDPLSGWGAAFTGRDASGQEVARSEAYNKGLEARTTGLVTQRQKYLEEGLKNFSTAQAGQKSASDLYKDGLDAAAKVTETMIKAKDSNMKESDEQLKQKKAQLELITLAANADQTKKLQDPKSAESVAARENTRRLLAITGKYTKDQIDKLLAPDGKPLSGWSSIPIGVSAGGTVEQLLKTAQAEQYRGQAAQAYGEAERAQAAGQQTRAETAGTVAGQQYNTEQLGMPAPDYAAAGAPKLTPKGPMGPAAPVDPNAIPKAPPQMTPHIGADGKVTWDVSTYSQQQGRDTAETLSNQQGQIAQYLQNGGKQAALNVAVNADKFAGPIAQGGKNLVNYTNNPEVKNYQLAIDRLNSEATELGLIAGKGSNSGIGAALGAGGAQLAKAGQGTIGTALSASAGMFNGGQPVTATTPSRTVKELSLLVQEARAKQAAHLATQSAYQKARSGDMTGYVNSAPFQEINSRVSMVNPKTGELILIGQGREALEQAGKNGFVPKEKYLGK